MGHASVTITFDRYGHLMPGNEDEAAALLDAYLERANTRARLDQISGELQAAKGDRFGPNPAGPVRQSFASQHRTQWTSTDFGGLNAECHGSAQTRMVSGFAP